MNKPIAKILLALIFLISIQISANAQDSLVTPKGDTIKVIVVVTPGQKYTKKPVVRFTAPSTAERSGADYNNTSVSKPVRTNAVDDDNTAPTTAERTGYHDYLNDHPKPRAHSNANVAATGTSSRAATIAKSVTAPVTAPAVTAPVTTDAAAGDSPAPYHDYLNNHPKPHTASNAAVEGKSITTPSAAAATPGTGDTATGGSATSSSTTTTTTTTTTTLPNGQKKISVKKTDTVYIKKTDTVFIKQGDDKTRGMKALYAEVGGPGLAISLNYDARFNGERKGWGYRVGAGYFSDSYGNTVFTVPLQVNYLLTKDENNFLELGAGTTFLNSTGSNKGKTFIFDKVTGFAGTVTIGYRYQPADHKLNFRIGFVPIFYDQGIIWAGGVSVGYNLK